VKNIVDKLISLIHEFVIAFYNLTLLLIGVNEKLLTICFKLATHTLEQVKELDKKLSSKQIVF
jgi:hypothetical protein